MKQRLKNIRNSLFFLLFFINIFSSLWAQKQEHSISGRITNDKRLPLEGVTVSLLPLNKTARTDAEGAFFFRHLTPGKYVLRFTRIGYYSKNDTLILSGKNTGLSNTYVLRTDVVAMNEIFIQGNNSGLKNFLPDTKGVIIYAGKKTDLISMESMHANLAQNVSRQAFSKVPGLNLWEMDGAGTQLNAGTRGTDPHRSIEMNIRQNGYITNSDIVGYPEDHYTIPLQAVEDVQLVRGSAALQFGSQFGGMLNFVMKQGDSSKPFTLESVQTKGSNNFFNSFNAIGGTIGKVNYYTYYSNRQGDGWRDHAHFNYHAYYADLRYQFNQKGSIAVQFSGMKYIQQIAGGLDDQQFMENPKQSTRFRNFFEPEIYIPAVLFNYKFNKNLQWQVTGHLLLGERNSVQFIAPPDVLDTVNTSLGTFNPRQVDRDYYYGRTIESRLLCTYNIGKGSGALTAGIRYFNQETKRKQKGKGTTGTDFDLGLTGPYGKNLEFHSVNYALFAENLFQLTPQFSVTPGFRYEIIHSDLSGVIDNASFPVRYIGKRNFPLFGIGIEYKLNEWSRFYGNWSQAYRPYLYASVTPADRIDKIDPDLKDSKGYDIDLGYRGNYSNFLHFDVNTFYVFYGNRVGLLSQNNSTGNYLLTTNIGDAVSKGAEVYIEASLVKLFTRNPAHYDIRIFNSLSYTDARYTDAKTNFSGENVKLDRNRVEGVPQWISRAGITLRYKSLSTDIYYNYVSSSYNDARNSTESANGAVGIVPAYHVWDWSLNFSFLKFYRAEAGINNLFDEKYFTRRITFYPGPGILPSDGRSFYVSFGVKL